MVLSALYRKRWRENEQKVKSDEAKFLAVSTFFATDSLIKAFSGKITLSLQQKNHPVTIRSKFIIN